MSAMTTRIPNRSSARLKTRPQYPRRPFASLGEAKRWVADFVHWYNEEHRHSAICYITPSQRHRGEADAILTRRRSVCAKAKLRTPERHRH